MRTPKEIFDDIVKLASSIGKEEVVNEEVISEEVALEEAEVEETEAPVEEAPVEEKATSNDYVTRDEYNAALQELKEMYSKVLEVVSPAGSKDVPEDLSSQETEEEVSVEMSEDVAEPEVEAATPPPADAVEEEEVAAPVEAAANDDVVHNPESVVEQKQTYLYGQGRVKTTADFVFESMFKK